MIAVTESIEAEVADSLSLRLVASASGLRAISFQLTPDSVDLDPTIPFTPPHNPVLREALSQLRAYFAGRLHEFQLPLDLYGTDFQVRVWRELQTIPYGRTCSYSAIAQAIGRPSAVRAVGAANGANPIPIVVPCHRVIGSSGKLVGYGGGLALKRRLLQLEGIGETLLPPPG